MLCSFGQQHHRIFPAKIQYDVYFDADRRTVTAARNYASVLLVGTSPALYRMPS